MSGDKKGNHSNLCASSYLFFFMFWEQWISSSSHSAVCVLVVFVSEHSGTWKELMKTSFVVSTAFVSECSGWRFFRYSWRFSETLDTLDTTGLQPIFGSWMTTNRNVVWKCNNHVYFSVPGVHSMSDWPEVDIFGVCLHAKSVKISSMWEPGDSEVTLWLIVSCFVLCRRSCRLTLWLFNEAESADLFLLCVASVIFPPFFLWLSIDDHSIFRPADFIC